MSWTCAWTWFLLCLLVLNFLCQQCHSHDLALSFFVMFPPLSSELVDWEVFPLVDVAVLVDL